MHCTLLAVPLLAGLGLLAGTTAAVPAAADTAESIPLTDIAYIDDIVDAADSIKLEKLVMETLKKFDGTVGGTQPIFAFSQDINAIYSKLSPVKNERVCSGPEATATIALPPKCVVQDQEPGMLPTTTGLPQMAHPMDFKVWLNSLMVNDAIWKRVNDPKMSVTVSHFYADKANDLGYRAKPIAGTPLSEGATKPKCVYVDIYCVDKERYAATPLQLLARVDAVFNAAGFPEPARIYAPAWVVNAAWQYRYTKGEKPLEKQLDVCKMNMDGTADNNSGTSVAEFSNEAGCVGNTNPTVDGKDCKRQYVTCMYI